MPIRDSRGTVGQPAIPLTRERVTDALAAAGRFLLAASSAADGPDPEAAREPLRRAAEALRLVAV